MTEKKDTERRLLVVDAAPFCGGAQESLWALMEALQQRDWRLHLCSADHTPGGLLERATGAGLATTPLHCRHWPASATGLWQFWQDRNAFQPLGRQTGTAPSPGVILANCLRSALLLRAAGPWPAPTLLYDRDVEAPAPVPWLLARTGLHVVSVSAAARQKWRTLPAERDSGILPNGFDLVRLRAAAPPLPPPPIFTLLQVADFEPWKGHALFLQTLAQIRREDPDIRGVIRGRCRNPAAEKYLLALRQQAAALGLDDNVQFVTAPGSALTEIAAADLLVSCSQHEAFGRVLFEALILNKPVIAVKAAGPAEYLADCPAASLVPPDPQALARAAIAWKQRRRPDPVFTAGLPGWLARFTLTAQADRLSQLLDELIR